jgi:hypothetical protein
MTSIEQLRERAKARARGEKDPGAIRPAAPTGGLAGYEDCRGFVQHTEEFNRVAGLPRVRWDLRDDLDQLRQQLTWHLQSVQGGQFFHPVQAVLLEALYDFKGCFGSIGVGEGKTLPSFVAGTLMDVDRTAVLVPAKLREKTKRDFADLAKHWQAPADIRIFGYEELGVVSGAEKLQAYAPGLVVADEVHALRNMDASRTRRVVRYLREHPDVAFMAMSGTPITRSLMDFYHLLALALGPDRMPLPAVLAEAKTWARAVDVAPTYRSRPGALKLFTKDKPTLTNIRRALESRIHETPGIIRTFESTVDAGITIDFFDPPVSPKIKEMMKRLVNDKLDPNGDECLPADVARHLKTLACGFWYRWDPKAPLDWMDARRDWKRCVRDLLDQQIPGLDSELQIARAADNGDVDTLGTLDMWRAVRGDFTPNVVAEWEDTMPMVRVIERAILLKSPTLIWVDSVASGKMLAQLSALPYFQQGGKDGRGRDIMDASGTIIVSIASNSEGRNLQAWSHNIVVTPPASGRTWEQLLGRTHRPGQMADTVTCDVMLGHGNILWSFRTAMEDARFIKQTTGQAQKLLLADLTRDL